MNIFELATKLALDSSDYIKGINAHSSSLAWKNPMDGEAWWAAVHGVAKSRT